MGMSERAKRRSCCASARLASRSVSEARPSRPGAPDHLHVALERLGVVVERHEADVRLVDPHPECGRGDHRLDPAFDEGFLGRGPLGRLEPRVVVDGRQVVGTQRAREALAAATGACVDDRRRAAQLVQPADERSQPRLLAVDDLDVVAEVRPDDARADDLRLAAQGVGDLPLRRRGRGRRHAEDRRPAERVERAADEEVVGAEVVPPHADAVHLVDHDETDVDLRDRVEEAPGAEPLGGDVEHPVTAFGHSAQPRRRLVGVERGVDQRRLGRDLGRQLVDLVLHQRDQRAQHERRSRPQHRGELVGERLARAGRHQRERVASLDGSADDGLLAGPEVVESEHARQREPELAHANECTERIGTHRSRLRHGFVSADERAHVSRNRLSQHAVLGLVEVDPVDVARRDHGACIDERARARLRNRGVVTGQLRGLLRRTFELVGELVEVRDRRRDRRAATCGALPPGPQPLPATTSTSIPAPSAISRAETPIRCLRSFVPSMTITRSRGSCVSSSGRQQLAAVPVRRERVVPHGGASAESFLDDPVALAELTPEHSGPARRRRIAACPPGTLQRDAPPGVGVAVAEDGLHRPTLIRPDSSG